MKKLFLISLLFAAVCANAQSDKYVAAMKKNLALMDSAKTTADFQNVSNAFERIGDAEKTQWLPYYYAGLALTIPAWADQKLDKDANAEKIKALCDKAEAIEKNAEICTIRNMAATQQMLIDPQTRWQTSGMEASAALQTGMKLDANNPRLYYLQGMSLFNTPEQFGGGKEKAKPLFAKSVELFKKEEPKPLYPHWGKDQAEQMLAKCQ
ncbi:MAG TPA: hypothetical protein VK787_01285 [Puia sp.]|jgi:hypothetical protein|nr:hypothetical protein [Puia sp.]